MPLSVINGKVLVFVHIPKTGGTSVERYLMEKGKTGMFSKRRLGQMSTTPQHIEWELTDGFFPSHFRDHAFAILRDPIDRLASEFRMRLTDKKVKQRKLSTWLGTVRSRGAEGIRQNVRLDREVIHADFNTWAELILDKCARDPHLHDNHLRPQSDFVGDDCQLFLFEDGLDKVFDWIDEVTETPPASRDLHHKKGQHVEITVSDRTRSIARDFYQTDYALIERIAENRMVA